MRSVAPLCAMATLAAVASLAQAAVIAFDEADVGVAPGGNMYSGVTLPGASDPDTYSNVLGGFRFAGSVGLGYALCNGSASIGAKGGDWAPRTIAMVEATGAAFTLNSFDAVKIAGWEAGFRAFDVSGYDALAGGNAVFTIRVPESALPATVTAIPSTSVYRIVFNNIAAQPGSTIDPPAGFDNINVTVVPEPAAFGVVGLAVVALTRRRAAR